MKNADSRIAAVRERLADADFGALIARDVANVTYLSAFAGVWDDEPASLVLVTPTDACVLTDSRYAEAAQDAASGSPWRIVVCAGDLWTEALKMASEAGVQRLTMESSAPFAVVERARGLYSGEIVPTDGWVEALRAVKDPSEVMLISAAQAITDAAFDHVLGFVEPGMTETQIALELEFFMRARGSEGVAFSPIVASGPNSARPHAHPGSRQVQASDFLKMDFGARVGGYCSDMTRTVVLGPASARQREIYETVLAANLAGIEAVSPGIAGKDVDAAARAVIEMRGFADSFKHGLGHGVGLEVHELPNVGIRSEPPLEVGNVVTIEPGVYVPGFGGVRIEDLVVVEAAGAHVLTGSTKELIEL